MDKYKQARLKLTLLYFGVIFVIVLFFSIFAQQINNAQYDRFDTPEQMEDLLQMRLRVVPIQFRDEFEARERAKNDALIQSIKDAKQDFFAKLILMDFFLLAAAGMVSVYLSHETLEPIIDAYKKQKKFVADASHELRTPIAAMKSETDVILRSKKATEQDYKDTLISVNEELDVLTKLSSYLLEIARSDDSKITLKLEEVDISKVIEKDLSKFEKIAKRQDIKIISEIEKNVKVVCDGSRVEQLLRIFLDNALKYNKPNGSIKVILNSVDDFALLEVSDTGVGIPKAQLDKIFDRFYRVSTDRHLKGFGLGLTIAKQIIDEHKGHIKVESKEGEWTKFTVALPLNKTNNSKTA